MPRAQAYDVVEIGLWTIAAAVVTAFTLRPDFIWSITYAAEMAHYAPLALIIPLVLFPPRFLLGGPEQGHTAAVNDEHRGAASESDDVSPPRRWAQGVAQGLDGRPGLRRVATALVVVGLVASFFLFRSLLIYGDSGNVARFVEQGEWFHKRAPLSIATIQFIHHTLGARFHWSGIDSAGMTSAFSGGIAFLACLHFARSLAPSHFLIRLGIVMAIFSSAASLLFIGYVEHYGLSSAVGLWTLALGVRAIRDETRAWPAVIAGTLAAWVHGGMLTLALPLLFLVWHQEWRDTPGHARMLRCAQIVGAVCLLSVIIGGIMFQVGYALSGEPGFGGGDGNMFVPLGERTGYAQYTLFSHEHRVALLNQWLLAWPLCIPGGLLLLSARLRSHSNATQSRNSPDPSETESPTNAMLIFIVLCGLAYFSLTLVWNPDIGAANDWDLFAPPGFFTNAALAALIVSRYASRPDQLGRLLTLVICVNLTRSIPWISLNCFPG